MASDTAAEAAIREQIRRDGRITFCQFMEMALYTAPGSYYGSEAARIGPRGDYFTSPEVHPSFGALLARQIEQSWVAMGRPDRFTLVEMGAGTGAMARDILSYAARWALPFYKCVRYSILEPNPALANGQRAALAALGPLAQGVTWDTTPSPGLEKDSVEGCVLSNEVPDSFPVHRVAMVGGELREVYVQIQDGRLVETLDEVSHPDVAAYFDRLGFLLPEGCRAEVNLAAVAWMAGVAAGLRRGAAITLDYGYSAEEMYSRRHCDGTLLCFYRHTLNDDPYSRIGRQDMTTHVDFTSLLLEGAIHGLYTLRRASQRSFLSALGMGAYLAGLPLMGLRHRDCEANRMGMLELLKPDGLGRIQVMVQQKGVDTFDPAGLRPEGLRSDDLGRDLSREPPPLLTRSHMRLNAPPSAEAPVDDEAMWHELVGEDED